MGQSGRQSVTKARRQGETFSAPTGHTIRTTLIDGEPWFVAQDVCQALGLNMRSGAARHTYHLPAPDKRTIKAGGFAPQSARGARGGLHPTTPLGVISEAGLYRLILRSDKASAGVFQDWVTREVLPSIRRTGGYQLADHGRTEMPLPVASK